MDCTGGYAQELMDTLGSGIDYSRADTSFSPFFSDIGLGIGNEGGIGCVFLHYNRTTIEFLKPFLALPGPTGPHRCTPLEVTQACENGTARIAFYGHNSWVVDCRGIDAVGFGVAPMAGFAEVRCQKNGDAVLLFDGYLPAGDKRNPDPYFPVTLGIRIIKGGITSGDGITQPVKISSDAGSQLILAFSVRVFDADHRVVTTLLEKASDADDAVHHARGWLTETLGAFRIDAGPSEERSVLAKAVFGLISNSTGAPGLLEGRIAAFPSRGRYPAHFLWDSCFQNLATELMHPRLASDSLLLLTGNLRCDGKMPHFICSTWVRPGESQPPLVGWAGLRLVKRRNDRELAAQLLPALRRNTAWWLEQRMTRFGLISAQHGLETGWDDSPRFDNGPTVACDMNSYLLLQMRACAEFSRMLGDTAGAAEESSRADRFARRMVDVLYDDDTGLFWDINVATGEPVRIMTPACFLPLLADIPLSSARVDRAICGYLIHPDHFFGAVPFPSVAYSQDCYQAGKWWRGPTWLPVAYLMLLILDKTGYRAEARKARKSLYRMVMDDGNLREHFNSGTGEGLGAYQQGWTAAVVLRLRYEMDMDG